MATHVLDTERLRLRWLEPADAPFVYELMNDPAWLEHIGDRGIRSHEHARRYIEDGPRAMCLRLGFGLYLVELRASGTPVGICGLIKRDWLDDVDVGFAFLPAFRGQGYASEAAAGALEHGRAALRLERIVAIVSPRNTGSVRVLERTGLRFERMVRAPGETQDVCLYATVGTPR